ARFFALRSCTTAKMFARNRAKTMIRMEPNPQYSFLRMLIVKTSPRALLRLYFFSYAPSVRPLSSPEADSLRTQSLPAGKKSNVRAMLGEAGTFGTWDELSH